MNPGNVTVRRISCWVSCQTRMSVTTNVAVHCNTVHKVILPGITSWRTRNPPEECLLRIWQFSVTLEGNSSRNHIAQGRGIHRKTGYSAVDYQLKEKEATRGMVFHRESQVHGWEIHRRNGILPGITSSWMLIWCGKIKIWEKSSDR
jgi:hypothetical protein